MNPKNIKNEKSTNQAKHNDTTTDINDSELISINQLPKKHKHFSSIAFFSLLFGFILLVVFYFYFTLNYVSPVNTALRVGDIKVTNETYDLVKSTMKKQNKGITDDFISVYLSDTIILSEKAKELGLTVNKTEYQDLISEYGEMAERVVLREKLEKHLYDQAIVTEDEIKEFYENAKNDYYISDSHFKYCAIQSDSPLPAGYIPDTSKLNAKEGTIDLFRAYGINNPTKGIFQVESEKGTYKYIIITDADIEYLPYAQVKDSIKKSLYIQKTDGKIKNILEDGRLSYTIRFFK